MRMEADARQKRQVLTCILQAACKTICDLMHVFPQKPKKKVMPSQGFALVSLSSKVNVIPQERQLPCHGSPCDCQTDSSTGLKAVEQGACLVAVVSSNLQPV